MPLGLLKPSFGLGEGGGRNGYIREDGVRPPNPRREDGMWVTPTPSINPRREDGLWNRALPMASPIYGAGGMRTTQPYNRMQDSMANAMANMTYGRSNPMMNVNNGSSSFQDWIMNNMPQLMAQAKASGGY